MLTSSPINCSNGLKILLKWDIAVTLQEAGQLKLEKIVTLRKYYFQLPLFALETLTQFYVAWYVLNVSVHFISSIHKEVKKTNEKM